ncbi:hypothetical protein M885DRAFT_536162 [Pelagophyceae sp. CCMP2097]|nr:hypothetical protein M885DRAFT_536162 [Pelagophyceae sp. CCMP2097]
MQVLSSLVAAWCIAGAVALLPPKPALARPRRRAVSRAPMRVCMLKDSFDLVVIGGGPVGVAACLRAAAAGRSAILIDATPAKQFQFTGPTGLFSKALRDAALKLDVSVLRSMGLGDAAIWAQVRELVDRIVRKCGDDNARALSDARVPHLRGRGRISDATAEGVQVDVAFGDGVGGGGRAQTLKARHALLATGSQAVRLLDDGLYDTGACAAGHRRFYCSDSIKQLTFLPRRVVVVGGGIIAVEFANIFAALGADVTLVVRAASLASSLRRVGIDKGLALELAAELRRSGIRLLFETEVAGVDFVAADAAKLERNPLRRKSTTCDPFTVSLKRAGGNTDVSADLVLTATGRRAVTGGLGLEELFGAEALSAIGDVIVKPDLSLACSPAISAAGDVIGSPQLASTGIAQAEAAVDAMFAEAGAAQEESFSPAALLASAARYPVGIWTVPELAFVGLTADAAKDRGLDVVVGVARYADTIRGHVSSAAPSDDAAGGADAALGPCLKLVVERAAPHVVVGVHIFGNDAAELVHFGTTLVQNRKDLASTLALCYAAVTYHELYKLAARSALEQLEADAWAAFYNGLAGATAAEPRALAADALEAHLSARGVDGGARADLRKALFAGAPCVEAGLFVKRAARLEASLRAALRGAAAGHARP